MAAAKTSQSRAPSLPTERRCGLSAATLHVFAGANSLFIGDTLLTATNPGDDCDSSLLRRLGLTPKALEVSRNVGTVGALRGDIE